MKREEWQVLISAYHDGELNEEEQASVETHLAECAECAAALEAYRRLGRTIRSLPRGVPSRELWLRVREALPSRRRRMLWRRVLPVASALAMLAIAVTLVVLLGPDLQVREIFGTVYNSLGEAPAPVAKEAKGTPAPAVTAAPEAPAVQEEGYRAPTTVSRSLGPTGLPPCPGQPLALEVVTQSKQTDESLPYPRLRGTLLDTSDQPLPGVILVISGTTGWQTSTTTASNGTFVVDLPNEGTYQVMLALGEGEAEFEAAMDTTEGRLNYVTLPETGPCLALLGTDVPPIDLGPHDEVILLLRVK